MHRTPARVAAMALITVSGLFTAGPVQAERKPSAEELGRRAEVITEQYNRQRLALARATRAKKAAEGQVRRADARYEQMRQAVGALAAENYMRPGSDSEVALLSDDPQAALDQSSASRYLAAQRTNQLRQLIVARMAYQRTAADARERATDIAGITADLAKKKTAIEKLISRIPKAGPSGTGAPSISLPNSGKASTVVNAALSRVGLPYVYGAAGPSSFDCSGLMLWAYAKVGLNLPHFTGAQYNLGTHVSRAQVRPGDILFFYPDLGHNGMYIGGGKMVHAPRTGKNVEVVSLADYYWSNFTGAVRIL